MATVELTKGNFEKVVSGNELVVVDFWAPWCGPCRSFGPVFEAASEKHADVVFGKVNCDNEQELAGAFGVRSIPYIMLLRQKIVLFAQAGMLPPEGLESVIQQARDLDMAKVRADLAEQETAAKE